MNKKLFFYLVFAASLMGLILFMSTFRLNSVNAQDFYHHPRSQNDDCIPITDVQISGPTSGFTGLVYQYKANIEPVNASTPITYTWSPEPLSGQGTSQALYRWDQSNNYTISVSVSNCGMKHINRDWLKIIIYLFITYGPDSDNDGIGDLMESYLCTSATNPDSDRDSLKDGWEILGLKFSDGDFIDLPSMGANPCKKDVFLQLDWEEGVAFTEEELQYAVNIFRLHDTILHISGKERPVYDSNRDGISDLAAHTAVQQVDENGNYYFFPKLYWTHIYGYARKRHGSSVAWGRHFTLDMLVSDRTYRLIHELGHTLGLGHGGRSGSNQQTIGEKGILYYDGQWINTNYKPNYLSIMNYRYSGSVLCYNASTQSWLKELDYTQSAMPTLNESNLDERPTSEFSKALRNRSCYSQPGYVPAFTYSCQDPDDGVRYQMISDGLHTLARKSKHGDWQTTNLPYHPPGIDWNCDGDIEPSVSGMINECFWCSAKNDWDTGEILTAPADWDFVPAGSKCHILWKKNSGWRPSDKEYRDKIDGVYCEKKDESVNQFEILEEDLYEPHEEIDEEFILADLPNLEMCDGIDNDGDGTVDEGCLDTDADGVIDTIDNCPRTVNADQRDIDNDHLGDACQFPQISNIRLTSLTKGSISLSWKVTTTDILGFNVYGKNYHDETPTFLGNSYPSTKITSFTDMFSGGFWDTYIIRPVNLNGQEGAAISIDAQALTFYYLPLVRRQ